jgi:hypothetical protein
LGRGIGEAKINEDWGSLGEPTGVGDDEARKRGGGVVTGVVEKRMSAGGGVNKGGVEVGKKSRGGMDIEVKKTKGNEG